MTDTVRYAIGFGPLGELAHRASCGRDVEAIFDHRRAGIPPLLRRHAACRALADGGGARPSKMRLTPGQVAGYSPSEHQATTPSFRTTSARFVIPPGSKYAPNAARSRPWARSPRAAGSSTPSFSRNAVCDDEASVETP